MSTSELDTNESSPFTSLGEKGEMEMDLWEGQFNLDHFSGSIEEDSSTHWGEESAVNMATVQQLQDPVCLLTDESEEDKMRILKEDNRLLFERIFMLEEQLREAEDKHEEALKEAHKINKLLVEKIERDKQIEHDNLNIRIENLETENENLKKQNAGLQSVLNNAMKENADAEDRTTEIEEHIKIFKEDRDTILKGWEEERESSNNIIQELTSEIKRLQGSKMDSSETDSGCHLQEDDLPIRMSEMEAEMRVLRDNNTCLMSRNQDLEGRLLQRVSDEVKEESDCKTLAKELEGRLLQRVSDEVKEESDCKTLAKELEELSENEKHQSFEAEIIKLRDKVNQEEETNKQLQSYIDSVLLSIMEKYPELLEVRR